MAKLVVASVFGVMIGVGLGAALGLHAQDEDAVALAEEAGVDPVDLAGALNTTGLDARTYLSNIGLLSSAPISVPRTNAAVAGGGLSDPPPSSGWPIEGALGQRIYCIEGIESRHGAAMYNPVSVWNGEHAQGWLGWLPSTARGVGAIIGNRWSEWQGAAYMLAHGRGREFAGVAWGRC